MKLSTKTRYATRALLVLSTSSNPIAIKDISDDQSISARYLENIFSKLKASKLITSSIGNNGGYILAKKPSEISIYDISLSVDGPLQIANINTNNKHEQYLYKQIYNPIEELLIEYLKSIDLTAIETIDLESI
ncbi:MAG: Rrf2 family transcriptional regulator [Erysipelotrichaceae bacterium]